MTWCFADEATPATTLLQERLESESIVVPSLWFLEVTNVLWITEKRKRISAEQAARSLALLTTFQIEVDDSASSRAFSDLLPICRTHKLTCYDAVYLDLAIRRRLPLATLDEDLRAAAGRVGIQILGR